jgi:hypothetical protein
MKWPGVDKNVAAGSLPVPNHATFLIGSSNLAAPTMKINDLP